MAGMEFTFTVTPDGEGPYEVVADSRDIYRWEKTNRGKTLGGLQNGSWVDMSTLCWQSARRQGLTDAANADEFAERNKVDPEEADEEPDPTQPAA